MSDGLRPRWALILGCSLGSGAAVARAVATNDGLDIIGVHRANHPDAAEQLRADVEAAGRRCELIVADAGKLANVAELVHEVEGRLPPGEGIALMLHSLADASVGPIVHPVTKRSLHPRQIEKTFSVMAHSFLFWGQGLVQADALAPGARMIALVNFLDEVVVPGGTAIAASKAALVAYIRYMANEFAPRGVRVNGVRFGAARTFAFSQVPGFETVLRKTASVNPLGRNPEPEDVAGFVSLLLDPRSNFVNGAVLTMDGGEQNALGQLAFRDDP